jgi:hypothetical protein
MTEPYKTDTISADEALMSLKNEFNKSNNKKIMNDFIRIHGFYDNPTCIIKRSEITWVVPFRDDSVRRTGAEITLANGRKFKTAESVDKIWEMLNK